MLEAILLVTALCIDAFVASIAYGTNKIKIPFISIITINVVCSSLLGISLYLGSLIREMVPGNFIAMIGILILLILGIYQLFESLVKGLIDKQLNKNKKMNFQLFDLRFVLEVYVDEIKADIDKSKRLNTKEAFALALALSLDGLAAGVGSGLGSINYVQVLLYSLIFHMIAIGSGILLGRKISKESKINISWVSGTILIFLALFKLITI